MNSPANATSLSQRVVDRCYELGFALAGICEAKPSEFQQELMDWLAAGKHGEMTYLQRNCSLRIDPSEMVAGATSILVVADRSWTEQSSDPASVRAAGTGKIARYARGDDYHKVMRKRLTTLARQLTAEYPGHEFRVCVDTAPVLEREHAQRAGIGSIGKNTLIIERGVGSYLLLGEIITTLPLEPSEAAPADPCSTCTRCIDACPTQAITPWSVDASRCISYLTIEHRSEIDERFHAAIGDWIFGCDICQEVCPHNQPTQRTLNARTHPAYRSRHDSINLLDVLNWDETARQQTFLRSSMKRAKLDMMKRNALIAAGNICGAIAETAALRSRIEAIAQDEKESAVVRDTARSVLRRLR